MKLSQKLATVVFVSACALSTNASAQDNAQKTALEQIVTHLVQAAVNSASNEIEVQLSKTLLTASNSISVDSDPVPANKIMITDLVATKNTQTTETTETTDNQIAKTDD
jgi:hypothetical protein